MYIYRVQFFICAQSAVCYQCSLSLSESSQREGRADISSDRLQRRGSAGARGLLAQRRENALSAAAAMRQPLLVCLRFTHKFDLVPRADVWEDDKGHLTKALAIFEIP